jgi:hypothetical protein
MKKLLIVGGAVTGAAFLVKRFASNSGGVDFERLSRTDAGGRSAQVDIPQHQRDPEEHGPHPATARKRGQVRRGFVAARPTSRDTARAMS